MAGVKQTLGHSAMLHGFIGALLAVPVMVVAFLLAGAWMAGAPEGDAAWFLRFWLVMSAVPAALAIVLYRIRQWLLGARAELKAHVIYGLFGVVAPLLALGLTLLFTQIGLALQLRVGGELMLISTIIAGFAIGILSFQAERRWT
jgi:hypothetical protein